MTLVISLQPKLMLVPMVPHVPQPYMQLARKQLEAMRHDAQRQRFKQQLQMFQHTPSGASQASRQARKAGDISKVGFKKTKCHLSAAVSEERHALAK